MHMRVQVHACILFFQKVFLESHNETFNIIASWPPSSIPGRFLGLLIVFQLDVEGLFLWKGNPCHIRSDAQRSRSLYRTVQQYRVNADLQRAVNRSSPVRLID